MVHFRHPASPDSEPDLLQLAATDGGPPTGGNETDKDGKQDGIDYETTFIA